MTKDYQKQKVYDWERSITKHFGKDIWGAEMTPKSVNSLLLKFGIDIKIKLHIISMKDMTIVPK